MCSHYQSILVYFLAVVMLRACFGGRLERFDVNRRVESVAESHTSISLLECAALFESNKKRRSFNYNREEEICELSENAPEDSQTADGWQIYVASIDGAWADWMEWGACSVTCDFGMRTRTRSCDAPFPSKGGKDCEGLSYENETCNGPNCFSESNYYFGTESVSWQTANATCEQMSARLVILESQKEIDFLEAKVTSFGHWIGITCEDGSNCQWVDGRSVDSGFTAWAPGEPNYNNCVWIGYYGNMWDDAECTGGKRYICEFP